MAKPTTTTHRSRAFTSFKNTLTVMSGLAIGVGILMTMVSGRPPANEIDAVISGTNALTIPMVQTVFEPRVTGLGTVTPDFEVTVLSEVAGRVIWVHPKLESGQVLDAYTVVVRLDNVDLTLALNQSKSDLAIKQHQLKQKAIEQQTYQLNLDAAKERLVLTSEELDRQTALVKKGLLSDSGLANQQQKLLSSNSEVANLELSLALLPSQIDILNLDIKSARSRVTQKERDLNRSEISVPKTGHIGVVNVVEGGYVGMASVLFDVSSSVAFEVSAQVSSNIYQQVFNTQKIAPVMAANVVVIDGGREVTFAATPQRIESGLDTNTRMMSVVVGLHSTEDAIVKGSFAEVTLKGQANGYWAVPRSAIYNDHVYMADENELLRIVPIEIDFYQDDYAILETPLPFDLLITSQVFPAIEGMEMSLQADNNVLDVMQSQLSKPQ